MNPDPRAAVHALIASHNRCDMTVGTIRAFVDSAALAGVTGHAILVDDGSTDGTVEHVRREFGQRVEIIEADGSLYWARSMAVAEDRALAAASDSDHLLWLNDDVRLRPDFLRALLDVSEHHPERPIVGSVSEPTTGHVSYGGLDRAGAHPLSFRVAQPGDEAREVAAMNGNVVLIPVRTARIIGGIDGDYAHALADIDYAWRATRAGLPPVLAPGYYGQCARNAVRRDRGIMQEWKGFTGIKGGGHTGSTARMLRKTNPVTWPLWLGSTYLLWWARAIRRSART